MKKAGLIIFVVLFFIMCTLPVLAMPLAGGQLPPLPRLYTAETGVNNAFGEETEAYLTENFAGRIALVAANTRLTQAVFRTSAERQVILGTDSWLFYQPTLQDYLGTSPLTARELEDLATTAALMQEYAEGLGSDFLFIVAPNKNSLYGQYMPWYTVPAGEQDDLAALAAAFEARGVAYCDLYALFTGQEGLYHKRDTHWNNAGARLAYNALLDALGHPHNDYAASAATVETTWPGDLDRLLFPQNGVLDQQVVYTPGPAEAFEYQGPARVDISRVVTRAAGGQGSLLCFRDSFGNALLPFMATAYADATFVSATPHTPDLLEPGQTLVIEIVQRNLRTLLQAAPRMPAPERALAQPTRWAAGSGVTISQEAVDYLRVYGLVEEALAEGALGLYVAVEGDGGPEATTYYQAFPALEPALLEDPDAPEDADGARGFSLYIPLERLPRGGYHIYPVVPLENEAILIEQPHHNRTT